MCLQFKSRPVKPSFRGRNGDTQHSRRFLNAIFFEIAKDDNFPKLERQALNSAVEDIPRLLMFEDLRRSRSRVCDRIREYIVRAFVASLGFKCNYVEVS